MDNFELLVMQLEYLSGSLWVSRRVMGRDPQPGVRVYPCTGQGFCELYIYVFFLFVVLYSLTVCHGYNGLHGVRERGFNHIGSLVLSVTSLQVNYTLDNSKTKKKKKNP